MKRIRNFVPFEAPFETLICDPDADLDRDQAMLQPASSRTCAIVRQPLIP